MTESHPIEDFATSPGETLLDSIEALGMTQVELADRIGLEKKTISQIIKGEEPIRILSRDFALNIHGND